jgi:glycosyltransferase involved in cell wall biosynthesis
MIKNEEQVIEKFINHHIKIADNLLLIDNGSTDNTLNIIEKYPSVHLVQRHEHFSLKNDIFAEYIQNSNYELIIPLDADELLVYDDDKISCDDTNIIKNYLQELCSYNDTLFKIKNIYNYISDNIYKIETDHWRSQKFFLKNKILFHHVLVFMW